MCVMNAIDRNRRDDCVGLFPASCIAFPSLPVCPSTKWMPPCAVDKHFPTEYTTNEAHMDTCHLVVGGEHQVALSVHLQVADTRHLLALIYSHFVFAMFTGRKRTFPEFLGALQEITRFATRRVTTLRGQPSWPRMVRLLLLEAQSKTAERV